MTEEIQIKQYEIPLLDVVNNFRLHLLFVSMPYKDVINFNNMKTQPKCF